MYNEYWKVINVRESDEQYSGRYVINNYGCVKNLKTDKILNHIGYKKINGEYTKKRVVINGHTYEMCWLMNNHFPEVDYSEELYQLYLDSLNNITWENEEVATESNSRPEGVILYTTDLSIFTPSPNNRVITKDKKFYDNKKDIIAKGYLIEPIICNRDMVIISGHHRKAIMEELYKEGHYHIQTAYIINPLLDTSNTQSDINKANNSKPTTLKDYISQQNNLYETGIEELISFHYLINEYSKYSEYLDEATFYRYANADFLAPLTSEKAEKGDYKYSKDNLRFCMTMLKIFDKHTQFRIIQNRRKIAKGLIPFLKCAYKNPKDREKIFDRIKNLVNSNIGITIKGNATEMAKSLTEWYNYKLPKSSRFNLETCSIGEK